MSDDTYYAPQSLFTGLTGRCPRCGRGHMFSGVLKMRPTCEVCGLEYADPGDGGAVFVILLGNILILAGALYVEFTFSPPWWVHVLLWVPACLIVSTVFSRLAKGLLVASQYINKAEEGRLSP